MSLKIWRPAFVNSNTACPGNHVGQHSVNAILAVEPM